MRSFKGSALYSTLFVLFLSAHTMAAPPIITNVPGVPQPPPPPNPNIDTTGAGAEYIRQLSLSQGDPPVTWDFGNPPIHPAGAQIDSTGKVTGWTPTTADLGMTFNFQVRATNAEGSNTVNWVVQVAPINNGFNAQSIYALRDDPPTTSFGKITEFDSQGNAIRDFTNWERWVSLSFSGTGDPPGTNNDAWCYTLRNWTGATDNPNWDTGPHDGANIRAFKSDGNVQYQCWPHLMSGWLPATNSQSGGIRGSAFHNSVFFGVDRNSEAFDALVVYELSIDLTQILNVYTGPNTLGGQVNLDINSRNGALYAINQQLGNLVAFSTAGGSTSVYTTLVNGQTFSADGQPDHNQWSAPNCVIYRPAATAADDTLVVFMNGTTNTLEFWINHGVDGNGNLLLKGRFDGPNSGWNGQFTPFDGTIKWGAQTDGFGLIQANNQVNKYRPGVSYYLDADSPSYPPTVLTPVIANLPPDPDETVAQFEYIRQLTVTQGAPVTWSLLQAPTGALIDQTGKIYNWRPSAGFAGSSVLFSVKAENSLASATVQWTVNVQATRDATNNGFYINELFAIKNYENPAGSQYPTAGKIELYEEDTMNLVTAGFTNIEGWRSLTFTGTGTNDNRCFAVRPFNSIAYSAEGGAAYLKTPYDSISIREFDQFGEVPQEIRPLLGASVLVGNIRYSPFSNTLLVGLDPNDTVHTGNGRAIEYNLNLTVARTYQGPANRGAVPVNVDVNPRNGKVYMISQRLGTVDTSSPLGDLVYFNHTFTSLPADGTLINGDTFAVSHPEWYLPNSVIFRLADTAAEDTMIVFTDGNGSNPPPVAMEFWADTTAHPREGGNLAFKGFLPSPVRGWKGQQDAFTRNLCYASMADGFGLLTTQNVLREFSPDDLDWSDAGSPRYPFVPGLCNNNPFADTDDDGDVDMEDFAFFQRCYSGQFSPIPTDPDTCLCLDRTGTSVGSPPDDHIDRADFFAFMQCATQANVPADPACDD